MKGQEALPEHLADDALRHRSTTKDDRQNQVARSSQLGSKCQSSASSAGNEERKMYVPMHLVPSDPVPQTALGAKLN